jgi:type VI secretion system protein ImpA
LVQRTVSAAFASLSGGDYDSPLRLGCRLSEILAAMSDDRLLDPKLYEPVAESPPVGRPLRTEEGVDSELRDLLDLARTARTQERKAEEAGEDPSLAGIDQWNLVKEGASRILSETSKDIETTALLIEALVRTEGFSGVAEGFELLARLANDFWPAILDRARTATPASDEELIGSLLRPIEQLGLVLPVPIARIAVATGGDAGALALWQYEQTTAAEKMNDEERERRKAITRDQFLRSVKQTAASAPRYFTELYSSVERAIRAIQTVGGALDEKTGGQAPSLTKPRERLDDVLRCLKDTASEYITAPESPAGGNGDASAAAGENGSGRGAPGQLVTREQAFQELSRIADFFARTEPLSLLAEQIREVVRRGHLAPDKYYSELIDNEDTLKQFFRLVGIRAEQPRES